MPASDMFLMMSFKIDTNYTRSFIVLRLLFADSILATVHKKISLNSRQKEINEKNFYRGSSTSEHTTPSHKLIYSISSLVARRATYVDYGRFLTTCFGGQELCVCKLAHIQQLLHIAIMGAGDLNVQNMQNAECVMCGWSLVCRRPLTLRTCMECVNGYLYVTYRTHKV